MAEITTLPCPHIPDSLTIPQFILESSHSIHPLLKQGTSPSIIEDATGKKTNLGELNVKSTRLMHGLHGALGIGRQEDDVVCIFSPNHVDYPAVIWAVHQLGAIAAPANPAYTIGELAHQLEISRASLIVCHSVFLDTAVQAGARVGLGPNRIVLIDSLSSVHDSVQSLIQLPAHPELKPRQLHPGEAKTKLAFLLFSSGTTGPAKAVAISHYSVIANIIQMATHYDQSPNNKPMPSGSIATAVLPFFHVYSLVVNMHFMLFCGISIVVIPKFSFEPFLQSIICKASPALIARYNLDHVKFCISGAAPLSAELTQQLIARIPNADIGQGYGLTETSTSVAMFPPSQHIATIGSAGHLLPGIVARVVKPDGSLARPGEPGELLVSGPSMALGYFGNEKATRETFIDGWVRTGDEVIIDDHGEVFIVDRIKEIMKVRGFQVAPAELEGHLLSHPDVSDSCVVSVLDEYSGEKPFAYVVLRPDTVQDEGLKARIMKHVSDSKVSYKWLAGVEFIDTIPKNPSGKILRRIMREQARKIKAKL